jgi:hypothetical protein
MAVIPKYSASVAATLGAAALLAMAGCHKAVESGPAAAAATAQEKEEPESAESSGLRVTLKQDEIEKLGIATEQVKVAKRAPLVSGFGSVLPHEAIAQAVAELVSAIAVEKQSRSALARSRLLAGTSGALPAETQETAERQATVDQAALQLAQQRLSTVVGQNPPWKNGEGAAELALLAAGRTVLVRVTFPLGTLTGATPAVLQLSRVSAGPGDKRWESHRVWRAAADAGIPGSSFFTLAKGSEVAEGERLLAWTGVGDAEDGVEVPGAAAVINGGKYWCFVQQEGGTFVRTELDTAVPTADGYFVREGIAAGDKVVTRAAGQLLAYQLNPAKDAD